MNEVILSDSNSFIGSWFLDDLTVCDQIIDYFESNPNKQYIGRIGSNIQSEIENSTRIKKSTDMQLDNSRELYNRYCNQLKLVTEKYIRKFTFCDNYGPWAIIEPVNIQKYNPGDGYYKWHTERINTIQPYSNRHLVFMTYLNDVTDQGETEFYYQKIKVQPRKGLTLIWPSDWTYTHRGITSNTEVKYIVTGWYNYV